MLSFFYELGNTCDESAYDGSLQSQGFHNDHWKSFRKTCQHECTRRKQFVANLITAEQACYSDVVVKFVLVNERLEIGAQFPIAGKRQAKLLAAFQKLSSGINQEQLSFLFTKAPDTNEVSRHWRGTGRVLIKRFFESAMDDVNLRPKAMLDKPE